MTSGGTYTVAPTNPVSVTGGTGTSATFTLGWGVNSTFTITAAGSGYVEQPTVSFSGGGGSGATAYATVGGTTTVKGLGSSVLFQTAGGTQLALNDASSTVYPYFSGGATSAGLGMLGATNATLFVSSRGTTGSITFQTNNFSQTQFNVSHTASAVNYVQVTGNTTGGSPIISSQGSDAAIGFRLYTKSTGNHIFASTGGTYTQFLISGANSAINYLQVAGTTAGNAPILSSQGSDTDIDLALTPKNAGVVRFGTYTGTILTPTGYITIKSSDGTTRRLLVG